MPLLPICRGGIFVRIDITLMAALLDIFLGSVYNDGNVTMNIAFCAT